MRGFVLRRIFDSNEKFTSSFLLKMEKEKLESYISVKGEVIMDKMSRESRI